MKINRTYSAHKTMAKFHRSHAFHRGVRGPRGSGKSTGCCIEVFRKSCNQAPSPDGVCYSRWAIVRNTYRELSDTTVKTWLHWFPEEYLGKFNRQSMTHHIIFTDPATKKRINAEFMFRSLDKPKDLGKTLSMELTGAYINEAKNIPFGLISGLDDAIGRYPAKDIPNGFHGPTWAGTILDTNAPDDDHWWFSLEEAFRNGELDPKVWDFFVQPGGLIEHDGQFLPNPEAENLENIGKDYYTLRMVGKDDDHIRIYYCNQFGFVVDGRPVHPEYVDAVHTAEEILKPMPNLPVYIGIDFGLTPAAVIGQIMPNGRWHVLDEVVTAHTQKMGIKNFSLALKPLMNSKYRDCEFVIGGDPAGSDEVQTDERTCFQILNAEGIPAIPAYQNNDTTIRREALRSPLNRLIDGKPGMLVSPNCKTLRKGLKGGFCYRRIQVAGSEKYHDKPDKNQYSHVSEAAEYMCLVAGEGNQLISTPDPGHSMDKDFRMVIVDDHGAGGSGFGWMG